MTNFKTICAAVALTAGLTAPAVAQEKKGGGEEYKPYPHMFIGVQGGAQTTFTNYNAFKIARPTASVSFGSFFTPVVGTRLHVNGLWNQGGIKGIDEKYDYKYVTTDLDLMLNLTNLFGKKSNYACNVILLGGIGLNYAWDNDDIIGLQNAGLVNAPMAWKDNRFSHNARVGVMFDFNVCKHLGINLEISANNLSDRYNSKMNNTDDWQATAQIGVAYKFGFRKKTKPAAEVIPATPIEEWATRVDTIWYDEESYKDVTVPEKLESNIYYKIRLTEPEPAEKIEEIVNFVKSHKDCKVSITGYADKGTGNARLNLKYSRQRAEKVTAALKEKGIDASIITTEWKGDTVQPFAENDKNRVAIAIVTGEGTKKEKVVTKKFRTEEVRYRVK
ncbi:MAG: OmpA family protein [Clostridium sp.]|nr:OmpA family protein [Clostridium sp.]